MKPHLCKVCGTTDASDFRQKLKSICKKCYKNTPQAKALYQKKLVQAKTEKGKAQNNERSKAFYQKNKAKRLAWHTENYKKNKERIITNAKAYFEAHKERALRKQKEWVAKNRERVNEYNRAYYHNVRKLAKKLYQTAKNL